MGSWDNEAPALAAAELVAGLEDTWRMIDQALARWTPADLGQLFSASGLLERRREEIFWRTHAIGSSAASSSKHEIHHGGELFLSPWRIRSGGGYVSI